MTAAINGRSCSSARVSIPRHGVWTAYATLVDEDALSTAIGGVTIEIAGLTMRGTVVDQGERNGLRSVELVGGYGGWRKPAPMVGGGFFLGNLKLSTYALAIARAIDEDMIVTATDRPIGPTAARLGGESSASVLSLACGSPSGAALVPWHVDNEGVTILGPRAALGEITLEPTDRDDLERWYAFEADDASTLMPGASLGGRPVEELRIEATPEMIREVVTFGDVAPAAGSFVHTLSAALRRFVLDMLGPRVAAARVYRYRVSSSEGGKIKARPVRALLAPDLDGVNFWPGLAGGRAQPKVGSEILVQFADGDVGYPIVVGFMPGVIGSGGIPVVTELDGERVNLGDGASGEIVARLTDESECGVIRLYVDSVDPSRYVVTYTDPTSPSPIPVPIFNISAIVISAAGAIGAPATPAMTLRGKIDVVGQSKVYA